MMEDPNSDVKNVVLLFLVIMLAITLFYHFRDDGENGSQEITIRRNYQGRTSISEGKEHTDANITVEVIGERDGVHKTKMLGDNHYAGETVFDDGWIHYTETAGQTKIIKVMMNPSLKFIDLGFKTGLKYQNGTARRKAKKAAHKAELALSEGKKTAALNHYEEALTLIANSQDNDFALSRFPLQIYMQTLMLNQDIGVDLLEEGRYSTKGAEYFHKTLMMIDALDKNYLYKQKVAQILPKAVTFDTLKAASYFNLGVIYEVKGNLYLKDRYMELLRSAARNDLADELGGVKTEIVK